MAMPHTIAVAGKGGVGKTTTCGMIIDYLCNKKNGPVLVVAADAHANHIVAFLAEAFCRGVDAGDKRFGSLRGELHPAEEIIPGAGAFLHCRDGGARFVFQSVILLLCKVESVIDVEFNSFHLVILGYYKSLSFIAGRHSRDFRRGVAKVETRRRPFKFGPRPRNQLKVSTMASIARRGERFS